MTLSKKQRKAFITAAKAVFGPKVAAVYDHYSDPESGEVSAYIRLGKIGPRVAMLSVSYEEYYPGMILGVVYTVHPKSGKRNMSPQGSHVDMDRISNPYTVAGWKEGIDALLDKLIAKNYRLSPRGKKSYTVTL